MTDAELIDMLRNNLGVSEAACRAAKAAADRIEQLVATVEQLEASLTRANAATAAAYEVAARVITDRKSEIADVSNTLVGTEKIIFAEIVSLLDVVASAIRALATPDQTAALDKLIAEAVADKDAEISQLNQDLNDMRDNVEIAYYRGYWAGGNGE